MNEITTVGLDLAKSVVSLCGEDGSGHVVVQRTLRREAVLGWFAAAPGVPGRDGGVRDRALVRPRADCHGATARGSSRRSLYDRSGCRGRTMRTTRERSARRYDSRSCAS